jgi:hypothetical protein
MVRSASRSSFLFEHDLFGKPDSTFPDHALGSVALLKVPMRRRQSCGDVWLVLSAETPDRRNQSAARDPEFLWQDFAEVQDLAAVEKERAVLQRNV